MTPEQKTAAARTILDNGLAHVLLAEMEEEAIDAILGAKPTDHDTRAAFAGEARAIRNFRDKLNLLIEEASVSETRAPAWGRCHSPIRDHHGTKR